MSSIMAHPISSFITHSLIVLVFYFIGLAASDDFGGFLLGVGILWGREAVQAYYSWRHEGWPRKSEAVEALCFIGWRWEGRNWFDLLAPSVAVGTIIYLLRN